MRFFAPVVAFALSALICTSACTSEKKNQPRPEVTGTYFSVRQFILDQFHTFQGQPYVFLKVVSDGAKTDSNYVAADTMAWAPVLDAFSQADIGDSAFVGQYRYSEFDEPVTGQHVFLYEAIAPELATRQLMIGADVFTGRILSIYMDVMLPKGKMQKLYYAPLRLIQIQNFSGKEGSARNFRVEYFFPQGGNEEAGVMNP